MKRFMLVLLTALSLAGCASLGTSHETEMLGVRVMTMKAIEASPTEKRLDQAKSIRHVCHEAGQWLTDADANLTALQAHVAETLGKENLVPSDQATAELLVSAITDQIRSRLPDFEALLTMEQKDLVLDILAEVEKAAEVYVTG